MTEFFWMLLWGKIAVFWLSALPVTLPGGRSSLSARWLHALRLQGQHCLEQNPVTRPGNTGPQHLPREHIGHGCFQGNGFPVSGTVKAGDNDNQSRSYIRTILPALHHITSEGRTVPQVSPRGVGGHQWQGAFMCATQLNKLHFWWHRQIWIICCKHSYSVLVRANDKSAHLPARGPRAEIAQFTFSMWNILQRKWHRGLISQKEQTVIYPRSEETAGTWKFRAGSVFLKLMDFTEEKQRGSFMKLQKLSPYTPIDEQCLSLE